MSRFKIGILVSAIALASGGCVARARVSGGYVATSDPMLVEIRPGVWVIEDYGEPVFYADGYYWMYRDDVWFRSSYYTGGWVRYRSVPNVIMRIEQPRAYVRYRGDAGVRVRQGPRGRVQVRDHRDDRATQPAVRHDNRPDVRDQRHEVRDERQDRREEQREERREEKQDERDDQRDHRDRGKPDKGDDKGDDKDNKKGKGDKGHKRQDT